MDSKLAMTWLRDARSPEKRRATLAAVVVSLAACFSVLAIPTEPVALAADLLLFGALLRPLSAFFAREALLSPQAGSARPFAARRFGCAIGLAYLVSYLALFPGVMFTDSMNIWVQANALVFGNWYPAGYTLFLAALVRIFDSPATVTAVTCAGYAALALATVREHARGGDARALTASAAFFALSPPLLYYAACVLSNAPYALALGVLTLLATRVARDPATARVSVLAPTLFMVFMLRHEGAAVAAVGLAVLAWSGGRRRWKVMAATAVALALLLGAYGAIKRHLRLPPTDPGQKYEMIAQHLAMLSTRGRYVSAQERARLDAVIPPADAAGARPYDTNHTALLPAARRIALDPLGHAKLLGALALKNPGVVAATQMHLTDILWRIPSTPAAWGDDPIPPSLHDAHIDRWLAQTGFARRESPLTTLVGTYVLASQYAPLPKWIVWRHGLYLVAAIALMLFAWVRCGIRAAAPFWPVLTNALLVLAVAPANEFRYGLPTVVALPILFLYVATLRSPAPEH